MYQSETFIRVRYGETDQMGYVYYGNYAMYCEVARVECLRQLGFSYRELEALGIIVPVLENYSKFVAPAFYDELIRITTTIRQKPTVRITFAYEFYNEAEKLIYQGETKLVFINQKTNRPCKPPAELDQAFQPFFP